MSPLVLIKRGKYLVLKYIENEPKRWMKNVLDESAIGTIGEKLKLEQKGL